MRRLCALPSKPPHGPRRPRRAPPRRCGRTAGGRGRARGTRSRRGRGRSRAPRRARGRSGRTSSEWVSRVRGKSLSPGTTTWVFAASRRSAGECSTRARSRSNAVRPGALGGLVDPPLACRGAAPSTVAGSSHTRSGRSRRCAGRPCSRGRRRSRGRCSAARSPLSARPGPAGRRRHRVDALRRVAIARVRSECHGSVTTTAVDQPSLLHRRLRRPRMLVERVAAGRRPR